MRIVYVLALFALLGSSAVAATPPKAQVMVVGVAHLVARRDAHNAVFQDSPLSPKRQAQITAIVERLARFHPTKVLVEVPYGDRKVQAQYRAYLAGAYTLSADEVDQFGFRLAARSGNAAIYAIDTWGPTLIPDATPAGKRIDAYLAKHFTHVKDPAFDAYIARSDRIERSGTYLDLLRFLNTDAAIRANASWYSIFAGMGRSADNAGAAYVAQWYVRNTYIFSNALSTIKPGDRVVILMGQGHEYLQREFVRLNPNLVDVNPLTYLNR